MIVTVELFNTFSGNFEDAAEAVMLKEIFLTSAEQIVSGYLGYDPLLQEYSDVMLSGSGKRKLYLPVHQITQLRSLLLNAAVIDPSSISLHDDFIYFKSSTGLFSIGVDNILASFSAGWEFSSMPSVITLSILRIATLMLSETNGNIGLTGKSFADNSRTFINYSNYKKYLQPLDSLRIIRF